MNSITDILDLVDLDIEITDIQINVRQKILTLQTPPAVHFCPLCNFRMHSRGLKTRTINHPVLQDGYSLVLKLRQRRWRCSNPLCGYTANEEFNFVDKHKRNTNATDMLIINAFRDLSASAVSIAEKFGVSDTYALETFDKYVKLERLPLTDIISVDEVHLDSVWTTNEGAIERMKTLKSDLIAKGDKVDWNFTEAFPFADDTNIKWMLNDTEWDPNRGIYCKRIFLDPAFENVTWYGRGPMENYIDRKDAAYLGVYDSTVTDMVEPYARTQSMGERTDTRWIRFSSSDGTAFKIMADGDLSFSAQHFTDEDIFSAKYFHNLSKARRSEVALNLDCFMDGIGNGSCGPKTLDKYKIKPGETYSFKFRIEADRDEAPECSRDCLVSWLGHPDGFKDKYTLGQVVALSRHNIRSPLSGKGSVVSRITPHKWFDWTSAPGELSLKGGALETRVGQFFRKWLVSEGLMEENEIPAEGTMRFYANSMQRTIATAQYFSSGMLPIANVQIERHFPLGTMDPVFNPQLTNVTDGFRSEALRQIESMGGKDGLKGVAAKLSDNFSVLEKLLDIDKSPAAANDTLFFRTDDLVIKIEEHKEPAMTGGFKMANSASDALVLQYYEAPTEKAAAFGHDFSMDEWEKVARIKDWYGDVLFSAPIVATNVAHPLLETMLSEIRTPGRKFSFLCGHDSNICSVLAALESEDYSLPDAIEKKTPIGSKLMVTIWNGKDGERYAGLHLVYESPAQLRSMPMLGSKAAPVAFPVRLKGLSINEDGLYRLSDLTGRFEKAISAY